MKRNAKFKRSMEAVALILPTVLIYTLVIAYPLLNMTYTSFFTWDGIPTSPYIFVGWENYHKFFTDIIALASLKTSSSLCWSAFWALFPSRSFWRR